MANIQVSIIIPVFNAEPFLVEAVAHIAACHTEYSDLEAIFVDDGSTDSTAAVLAKLISEVPGASGYMTLLHLERNGGPGVARNAGMARANGRYVSFLDVDDHHYAEAFAALCRFSETADADLIPFDGKIDTLAGDVGARRDLDKALCPPSQRVYHFLRAEMDASVIFTLFRQEFLKEHALTFDAGLHEDIAFLFEAYARAEKVRPFNEVVYHKQAQATSIVHTVSTRHIDGIFDGYGAALRVLDGMDGVARPDDADIQYGLRGFVSDLVLKVKTYEPDPNARLAMYRHLYDKVNADERTAIADFEPKTFKDGIVARFMQFMTGAPADWRADVPASQLYGSAGLAAFERGLPV